MVITPHYDRLSDGERTDDRDSADAHPHAARLRETMTYVGSRALATGLTSRGAAYRRGSAIHRLTAIAAAEYLEELTAFRIRIECFFPGDSATEKRARDLLAR